jgi:hypothetical protein
MAAPTRRQAGWDKMISQLEFVDETPRRPRRSDAEKCAEEALGHAFVSLIGYAHAVPRYPGDNLGFWPMHVEVNADWRQSGMTFDRQQPAFRAVRWDVIGLASKRDADLLKGELDMALMGREHDKMSSALRQQRFRNVVDFGAMEHWWPELVYDAVMMVTGGVREMAMFSRDEHDQMLASSASSFIVRSYFVSPSDTAKACQYFASSRNDLLLGVTCRPCTSNASLMYPSPSHGQLYSPV